MKNLLKEKEGDLTLIQMIKLILSILLLILLLIIVIPLIKKAISPILKVHV